MSVIINRRKSALMIDMMLGCKNSERTTMCCIRCGPDEERILDVVPREDGARNSG